MKAKLRVINDILSWILLIAVTVMLIFSVYTVVQAKKTGEPAFVFGYRPVLVLTGSMEPYMMTNGVAITEEVTDISQIAVGDVITFHLDTKDGKQLLITHRIVSIDENGLIYTKGDNNRVEDSIPLTMENVESKVVYVMNWTAKLVAKWQTTAGKVLIISCVVGVILMYCALKLFIKSLVEKDEKTEEQEELPQVEDAQSVADRTEAQIEGKATTPELETDETPK